MLVTGFSHQMSDKEYTLDEVKALAEVVRSWCSHDNLNFYADLSTASGCWTVIHGEADCEDCGFRFKAVLEGSWKVNFDEVVENSTL